MSVTLTRKSGGYWFISKPQDGQGITLTDEEFTSLRWMHVRMWVDQAYGKCEDHHTSSGRSGVRSKASRNKGGKR